jgi:hypothetical protein
MASGSFAVSGAQGTSFGFASTNVALPGSGAVLRIANLGPCHITVALGTGSTTVNQSNGLTILAGQTEWITVSGATNIAGVAAGGPGNSSTVNLSTGALTAA